MNYSEIRVGENSTEEFLVLIVAHENATDGYTVTLTVVAQSTLDESNDFAVFKVTITTRPPPEFTDNVSKHAPTMFEIVPNFSLIQIYGEPSSATELSGCPLVLCCAVLMILRESIDVV